MEAAKRNSQGLTEETDLEGQRLVMVETASSGTNLHGHHLFSAVLTKSRSLRDSRTRPGSEPSQVYTAEVLFLPSLKIAYMNSCITLMRDES